MDHNELIAELPRIEKLPASERLKIARERRTQQLLRYERHDSQHVARKHRDQSSAVRFVHNVVLLEAAARNDIEEVRRLLAQGVDPDSQNEDGLTALHQCCIDNSETMMRLLLEFGANVNAEDSERWTPLHAAATCGHLHLVQYLIVKGANLLAVNADGNMPYDICEDEATLDFIESEMAKRGVTQKLIDDTRASTEKKMLTDLKELANRGESLELEDFSGARPLHIAAANGYLSVVEFLLDQHVTTDCKDHDGWQPIHAAACWGHLEVLELLVQNGSDLNALTNSHETPFDICEDPEMKSRIAALRSEQESRARADHQRNRRAQSSNTRTHSIRRNSTRDKGQISKKHIKNEAICGIQNGTTQDLKAPSALDSLDGTSVDHIQANLGDNGRHQSSNDTARTNEKSRNELRGDPACRVLSTSPVLTATCVNENTIDIRVSVTINAFKDNTALASSSQTSVVPTSPQPLSTYLDSLPSFTPGACTLADLKKQRSLSRVSGLNLPVDLVPTIACNPVLSNFFILPESTVNGAPEPPYMPKSAKEGTKETQAPGKAPAVHKFQGETAELVGADSGSSSCCVVS